MAIYLHVTLGDCSSLCRFAHSAFLRSGFKLLHPLYLPIAFSHLVVLLLSCYTCPVCVAQLPPVHITFTIFSRCISLHNIDLAGRWEGVILVPNTDITSAPL